MTKAKQLTPRGQARIASFLKKRSLPLRMYSPNQSSSPDMKKAGVSSNQVEVTSNEPSPMVICPQRDKPKEAELEEMELIGQKSDKPGEEEEKGKDKVEDKERETQNKTKVPQFPNPPVCDRTKSNKRIDSGNKIEDSQVGNQESMTPENVPPETVREETE